MNATYSYAIGNATSACEFIQSFPNPNFRAVSSIHLNNLASASGTLCPPPAGPTHPYSFTKALIKKSISLVDLLDFKL